MREKGERGGKQREGDREGEAGEVSRRKLSAGLGWGQEGPKFRSPFLHQASAQQINTWAFFSS